VGPEIVAIHEEHQSGIEFIERVENAEKVARMTMGSDSEDITERGR
jgi:hypothetical protein